MVATAERTGRKLETATAPTPPGVGEGGFPVRTWDVNGKEREFSLQPFPDGGAGTPDYDESKDQRPRYWYIGVGARLMVKDQRINEWGVQPVIMNDRFVDGSFRPRNEFEEHLTREFLRKHHIDPDKSRDERHPEGPGKMWICGQGFCGFAVPSWHVFQAHQKKLRHKNIRSE